MAWRANSFTANSYTGTSSDTESIISLKSTFIDVPEPKTVLRRTKSCPDHEIYGSPTLSIFQDEREYVDALWGRAQSVCKAGGARSECSTPSSCSGVYNLPQMLSTALSPLSPTGYISCHALASEAQIPRKHRLGSSKMVASSNRGLSQALATIEELPQQLEEALQQKVVAAVTDMKGSLLELCSHIQAAPGADSELATQLAVERIGRIPDQIMQEINGTVAEVKESIEAKMESFVMYRAQPEGTPMDQETLVNEMSLIPTQVEEMARGVVDNAIDATSLKAVAQMDRALASLSSLPSHDKELAEARSQVMAALPGTAMINAMSRSAEKVAKTNVQGAIASARGNISFTANENKNVANFIMSSKAEMSGQQQHRHSLDSESNGMSLMAQRSNTSQGAPTPRASRLPQGGSLGSFSLATSSTAPKGTLGSLGAMSTPSACNAGSKGHPEMCKKPCLFFQAGQCQQLTSCCFCHLVHPKRTNHLDKRNRELLTKLPVTFRIQILLHAMRSRASMLPFEQAALEFVDSLDAQCGVRRGMEEEPGFQFDKGYYRLRSALLGQVFSSLASLFFKVTSEEVEPAGVARMKQAFTTFQNEIERLSNITEAVDNPGSGRPLKDT